MPVGIRTLSNPSGGLTQWGLDSIGAWVGSPNAWMRGEEITSCKSHIASVSLIDWGIMIFLKKIYIDASDYAHIRLVSITDMSSWSSLFLKIFAINLTRACRTPVSRQDRISIKIWVSFKESWMLCIYCFVLYINIIQVDHHCVLGTGARHAFRFLQYLYCSRDTIVLLFLSFDS